MLSFISQNIKYFSLLLLFFAQSVCWAAIPNENSISQNILRGGRPANADLDRLKVQGYKAIISFENNAQAIAAEKQYAEKLGFKFFSYPMNAWNKPNDSQINEVLMQMSEKQNYPLFIHCEHGRDRTGLVSALYRVLKQGWKAQDAHEEMLALGFRQIFFQMDNYFWKKTGATKPVLNNPIYWVSYGASNFAHTQAGRNL